MRKSSAPYLVCLILAALLFSTHCNSAGTESESASSGTELATEDDKTIYAIGLSVSASLEGLSLTPEEAELLKLGLTDGLLGREPQVDAMEYQGKIQQLAQGRMAAKSEAEAQKGKEFLEQAAKEEGVEQKDSGILIQHVATGEGPSPGPSSSVRVHYHGTLVDGTVFDSSVDRGEPIVLGVNRVIPCWTEALQTMKVGGKAKLVCPSSQAYGDQGSPPTIPPGATILFEVELIEIVE